MSCYVQTAKPLKPLINKSKTICIMYSISKHGFNGLAVQQIEYPYDIIVRRKLRSNE